MGSNECLGAGRIAWRRVGDVRLVLVDLTSITLYPRRLVWVLRFMIDRERHNLSSRIYGHKCAAITNISNVTDFSDNEHDDGTRTTPLDTSRFNIALIVSEFEKVLLSLLETSLHGLDWVLRELGVPHNHLMKLVSEEVRALSPSVTIVDGEE